jgi:hypothetical protein
VCVCVCVCRCGNIQYVPFVEHPRGASFIPEFHPDTFVSLEVPDQGSVYYQEWYQEEGALRLALEEERKRTQHEEKEGEGDLDLSRMIDDNDDHPPGAEEAAAAAAVMPAAAASEKASANRNTVDKKGDLFFQSQRGAPPMNGGDEPGLYRSIAIELSGFCIVFLMFYCICIPSRSLKKQ